MCDFPRILWTYILHTDTISLLWSTILSHLIWLRHCHRCFWVILKIFSDDASQCLVFFSLINKCKKRYQRQSTICAWDDKWHGLRTPGEEIAFTARPKINSHSQIFRYGQSIFCLPHRPKLSELHCVSVVRDMVFWSQC